MQANFREWIKGSNYDFMGKARLAMTISGIAVLVSLLAIFFRGLNFGLDFTGGTVVEVGYPAPVEIGLVRENLARAGFADAQTQHFGTSSDVLIRIPPHAELNSAAVSSRVLQALQADGTKVQVRRVEFVGPQVGQELVEAGGLALLIAVIGILIYVTLRFEWRLALGTILALIHDAIITIGVFSLFGLEFNLTIVAAVLAIIGYSVNDSVVVLDRIRENFRKLRRGSTIEIMNASINQTLSRTIITNFTVLLAILVLLVFGGPVMRGFSIAMTVGAFVGTYSSIYIASAAALELGISREDLVPRPKQEVDQRP
jgi:preprotein translocase subunit SecF